MKRIARAVAALLAAPTPALAQEPPPEVVLQARTVVSAFYCGQYASLGNMPDEAERLYNFGIEAGREFLSAVADGALDDEAARWQTPILILIVLSGPTEDFILGRIYQSATSEAYDNIAKEDDAGLALPMSDWIYDTAQIQYKAYNRYHRDNCSLIR